MSVKCLKFPNVVITYWRLAWIASMPVCSIMHHCMFNWWLYWRCFAPPNAITSWAMAVRGVLGSGFKDLDNAFNTLKRITSINLLHFDPHWNTLWLTEANKFVIWSLLWSLYIYIYIFEDAKEKSYKRGYFYSSQLKRLLLKIPWFDLLRLKNKPIYENMAISSNRPLFSFWYCRTHFVDIIFQLLLFVNITDEIIPGGKHSSLSIDYIWLYMIIIVYIYIYTSWLHALILHHYVICACQ